MIEVVRLTKSVAGKSILRSISFTMQEGRMYGIIGANGAGKSTLLQLLTGLEPPDSGEVLLRGREARAYKRKELAKWTAMLQQGGLPPVGFTVREVVTMGRFPYQNWIGEETAGGGEAVDAALEAMGLAGMQHRRIDQLSGGERQRVALAKVMAQEPELLMLDEPTTYLDIGYQVGLLDTVKQWQRERGLTVVAVLHDLNLAAHYCDELLVLHDGGIEAFGPPAAVIRPEMIQAVYGANAIVLPHPDTGVPQILLQSAVPPGNDIITERWIERKRVP
ncbi:ABC transporter ATP-binding protein [Paenibacillus montanisoli]|uniref:ABC transporter ATP-binding protein n=1 Tax=Paenibacillus montanisoli TaxID=2081970 RepID=A0A328U288_9BACL|nr:ABC transporter ATP-binding protein [Paenibacillus montanisoli]RAP76172.1 ABC transporter ATP-binding protein [Paenibacillus montanisoli]